MPGSNEQKKVEIPRKLITGGMVTGKPFDSEGSEAILDLEKSQIPSQDRPIIRKPLDEKWVTYFPSFMIHVWILTVALFIAVIVLCVIERM
ncbi:hypothetical protein KA005_30795 [bacterium]|nr:hypothetical protein [bacterium]